MNYRPQLANPFKGKLREGLVFEPKYDGWRVLVRVSGGKVSITTRNENEHAGKLPHLEQAFLALDFDFVLDGELVSVENLAEVQGKPVSFGSWGSVQSVMGSRSSKDSGKIAFAVFDCLSAQGKDLTDLPDFLRRGAAELVVDGLNGFTDYAFLVPRWIDVQDPHRLFQDIVKAGGEGLMVKNHLARYVSGKRSDAWLKWKATHTADVIITGYEDGKGDFKGLIGSVKFAQYRNGVKVDRSSCSGMNMAMRREFTYHGAKYLGRVMEVKYYVGLEESFRHPQFLRIRDDKRPEECEWDGCEYAGCSRPRLFACPRCAFHERSDA